MNNKYVINIGRQLGSGGREIGAKLAAQLHIDFYDKELINIASKENKVYEVDNLQVQNDGNNVSLDREMSEMAKNNMVFQALQAAIKKDSALFRSVIDSSGKN